MFGLLDLFVIGRHLIPGPAVDDGNLLRSQTQGRTGRIDGHISSADDRHLLSDLDLFTEVDPAQEIDPGQDALGIFPGVFIFWFR